MSYRSPVATDFNEAGIAQRDADAGSFSVIDRYSVFDGTFRADRDLRIEGEVKGTIDCNGTLFIAQGATVAAKVEAENITIAGDMSGEIQCRGRLQLLPSGRLNGKVNTSALVINEGAIYEGQLAMTPSSNGSQAVPSRPQPANAGPVAMNQPSRPQRESDRESSPEEGASASSAMPSTFIRRLGGPETPWSGASSAENGNPEPQETDEE